MNSTRGVLVLATVVVLVGLTSCLAGGMMGAGMRHGMGWGDGWGGAVGMGLGGLAMVAFWVAVVGGFYLLARDARSLAGEQPPPGSPMDIVKRRYAAGEITREQFEQMRRDLEG